jgi:hypothetical protein
MRAFDDKLGMLWRSPCAISPMDRHPMQSLHRGPRRSRGGDQVGFSLRVLTILTFVLLLVGCRDDEVTGSVSSCAAKLYSPYDRKNFAQCVDVCNKCERGTATTCSMSCRLKGAQ